jgi:hypothetical protein
MKIVSFYKYLGILETAQPHNYTEFIKSKWKSVRARIAKCRRVGGHIDGLNAVENRKLYFSQIRPIIEFGGTTIPYKETVLKELEKMQAESLRSLFGFYKHTKFETMLTLVGVTRMRSRIAQLKVCFYNKLKTFNNLYLTSILRNPQAPLHGLREDIQKIYIEWSPIPHFAPLANYESLNTVMDDTKKFNAAAKAAFEKCDMYRCLESLHKSADSASGGSGQAAKALDCTAPRVSPALCSILRISTSRRRDSTLLMNTLSGCDFVTPFSHKNKPICRMCRSARASWCHLLLECPKRRSQNDKILADIKNNLEKVITNPETEPSSKSTGRNSLSLLENLIAAGDNANLARFLFGICCTDTRNQQTALRHIPVLQAVMQITAGAIRSTQEAWWDATLEEYGIVPT